MAQPVWWEIELCRVKGHVQDHIIWMCGRDQSLSVSDLKPWVVFNTLQTKSAETFQFVKND